MLCGERWPGRLGERRKAQDALEVSGSYRKWVPWAVACISWVAAGRLCRPHRGLARSPAALVGAASAGRRTGGSDVAAAAPSSPPSAAAVATVPSRSADRSGTGTPPGSAPLSTARGHDRSPAIVFSQPRSGVTATLFSCDQHYSIKVSPAQVCARARVNRTRVRLLLLSP